jgi:hypothetical protein
VREHFFKPKNDFTSLREHFFVSRKLSHICNA